uniref:Uncharacterized protein n=1 Tax=Megaviridae environmental sample TaxID=1737588 RepID=A0A5J6VI63_9VIRU|nr:MAG: hypothetical protein [Megaviridae environmental sample]
MNISHPKLLFHVVGISKTRIEKLVKSIKLNVKIIDLDEISHKFTKKKNLRIENMMCKQYAEEWKDFVIIEINKQFKTSNFFILLGLINFSTDHPISLKIDVPAKYFLKVNLDENAREIIRTNLDIFRNEIIQGTFPIALLDFIKLKEKRVNVQKKYITKKYELLFEDEINANMKNILLSTKLLYNSKVLFVPLKEKLKTSTLKPFVTIQWMNRKRKVITAYSKDWVGIIDGIKNITYSGNTIIENKKNTLNKSLNNPIYLYIVSAQPFIEQERDSYQCIDMNPYKYITTDEIQVMHCQHIPNALEWLARKDLIKSVK